MEFVEYPKSLYKAIDDMIVVGDKKEEKDARKAGYTDYADVREGKAVPAEAAPEA